MDGGCRVPESGGEEAINHNCFSFKAEFAMFPSGDRVPE